MNRYGRLAHDYNRRFRPTAFAEISNPEVFFAEAGDEIQAAISEARDEILGPQRPGEDPELYRQRSYQASRTAEEIVLADHHLLVAPPETDDDQDLDVALENDPELAEYYQRLAMVNQAIADLHTPWTAGEE